MPIAPGSRVGAYEIVSPLGEGGMGEVWRARDTKLNRDVAIKILPDAFAHDADRVARFAREAQALAALNHPNIAQIYGVIEETGVGSNFADRPAGAKLDPTPIHVHALVMELVEGEDLSARLLRGLMPLDDALPIARQIADALEAAHEQGIIHRDLKPANIKVRADGTVKVLDFGLAKALVPQGASGTADATNSPTMTSPGRLRPGSGEPGTEMGLIIGTAAYMAPEQARGKPVDRRADIWAFGVVLYEMLTGRRLFSGDDTSDVLAAVLRQDVDWTALPAGTTSSVRRLLRRCLEKDPKRRLGAIADARLELDEQSPETPVAPSAPERRSPGWWPWALTAVVSALAIWALLTRASVPATRPAFDLHLAIELTEAAPLVTLEVPAGSENPLAVSPDGRHVIYVAPDGASTKLYVRAMADLIPRALPGTEGARAPFLSPDGQWVGFFASGKLKKTPIAGGAPTPLADAPEGCGGSWTPSGDIVFAPGDTSSLSLVSDAGGTARAVTKLDFASGEDAHRWPQVLPGGRAAIFTVYAWSRETTYIALVDLASGATRTVQEDAGFARYVPGGPAEATGHLVFVRNGTLVAAPFDPARGARQARPPPLSKACATVSSMCPPPACSSTRRGRAPRPTIRSSGWIGPARHTRSTTCRAAAKTSTFPPTGVAWR